MEALDVEALDATYGPNLRSGNKDLDPFIKFFAWRPMVAETIQLLASIFSAIS